MCTPQGLAAAPDRWLSEARLPELLARQGEAFGLDYKTILDIENELHHLWRVVKLVVAMAALSGDILVGAHRVVRPRKLCRIDSEAT